jgi:DNA-binding NtrC family response regulator
MRHRVLVLAQDVTLRSTLARWLVGAGYLVELAENDRRARQLLANQRMALTIVVLTAGTPIFDPGEKGGKLVIARPVYTRSRGVFFITPGRAGGAGSGRGGSATAG